VQIQLKKNNPNATRRWKRFFASDFIKVAEMPKASIISSKDDVKLNKLKEVELPSQIKLLKQKPISKPKLKQTEKVKSLLAEVELAIHACPKTT